MVETIILSNIIDKMYEWVIDILKNLAGSLAWAIIAFVTVYFYNRLTKWFYKRKFYKTTRLNINPKQKKIYIPCYIANSSRYDETENVYLGYPFEYMASASINTFLSLIIKNVNMDTTLCPLKVKKIEKIDKSYDLILLGGPFHNMLTELFFGLSKANTNMPFYFDTFEGEDATLFYKDNDSSEYKRLKPIKDPVGNYYCEDYGLIINIRNPYNPKKRIIAIIGCRSIGVLGATLAFTTFNDEIMKKVKYDEYAVIIKCYGDQNNVNLDRELEHITTIKLDSLSITDLVEIKDRI